MTTSPYAAIADKNDRNAQYVVTLRYSFGERVTRFYDASAAKNYAHTEGIWGYANGTVTHEPTGRLIATIAGQLINTTPEVQ